MRALLLALCLALLAGDQAARCGEPFSVLVFSKTAKYRHASIPAGIEALNEISREGGFTIEATEDAAKFTAAELGRHAAVVFLNTTGDVLDEAQQAAFEGYVRAGGGFVGVHAASDTEFDWPWYGRLVGAYFDSHPKIQKATIRVLDREDPTTRHLPEAWERTDEWYDFRSQPPETARILATVDESTYRGGKMGARHPVIWRQDYDGGRSWYTALGHTKESYAEPEFRQMLREAIRWAAGRAASSK